MYGIAWSPVDGSVWGSNLTHPGYIVRLASGSNPPDTALAELYRIPLPGFGIRGMDIDRNGVVWVALDSAKGIDGRIDDPNAGWKGRGLWVTSGNRTPFHIEGVDAPVPGAPGKTQATLSSPLVVQFQLRPDPLAQSSAVFDRLAPV